MAAALGWGALAASSLVIGALFGLARRWPDRPVGALLAFGAGALISAVSFELVEEGQRVGSSGWLGLGLAAGALTYFVADRAIEGRSSGGGTSLGAGAVRPARWGGSSTGCPSRPCWASASPPARG